MFGRNIRQCPFQHLRIADFWLFAGQRRRNPEVDDFELVSFWIPDDIGGIDVLVYDVILMNAAQDIGDADVNLAEAESFHGILRKAGIFHEWHLYPGLHNDAYWISHLEEYLIWYSSGWGDL